MGSKAPRTVLQELIDKWLQENVGQATSDLYVKGRRDQRRISAEELHAVLAAFPVDPHGVVLDIEPEAFSWIRLCHRDARGASGR